MPLHRRLPSFLVQLLTIISLVALAVIAGGDKTYYEILNVDQDASLQTIKKAYRKLAMEHHPDRNRGNEKQAEIIFRDISEAYEVLSDETSRKRYDQNLKYGGNNFSQSTYSNNFRRSSQYRDPFAQFNDLFQNDEFFKSAAKGLDDLFTKVFEEANNNNQGQRRRAATGGGGGGGGGIKFSTSFGSSSSTFSSGSSSTTTTSRSSGSWGFGGGGGGTYESRSTRTIIQNGKRITIQVKPVP